MPNILIKSKNRFVYQIEPGVAYNTERTVNDKPQLPGVTKDWFELDEEPRYYTDTKKTPNHIGWKLKETFVGKGIPDNLPADHFVQDSDYEYPEEVVMYEKVYEDTFETTTTDIVWNSVFEEDTPQPVVFKGLAKDGYFATKEVEVKPLVSVIHEALYPEPILPTKPCALSSDDLYKIIRSYVKDNIDPKYATITSDYDFCFTVKKKLAIPLEHRSYDANALRRTKRIKLVKYTVDNREVKVFEMTNQSSAYNGYPIISGITANNHTELKDKVDTILNRLITTINEPVRSCEHCGGTGSIVENTMSTKELTGE